MYLLTNVPYFSKTWISEVKECISYSNCWQSFTLICSTGGPKKGIKAGQHKEIPSCFCSWVSNKIRQTRFIYLCRQLFIQDLENAPFFRIFYSNCSSWNNTGIQWPIQLITEANDSAALLHFLWLGNITLLKADSLHLEDVQKRLHTYIPSIRKTLSSTCFL